MGHLTPDATFRVEDLARVMGATPAELTADLEALSMCGTDDLDPYSMVPIMIEDGILEVFGPLPALSEPVRLSSAEATALAAALQTVGFGADEPLVTRILSAASAGFDANALEHTVRAAIATHESSVFSTVADAAQGGRVLEIEHVRAGTDDVSVREIEPATLFAERGAWYVTAWCRRSEEWRTFRIDRIRRASETGERFDSTAHGTPAGDPTAFDSRDLPVALLRFLDETQYLEREWPGSRLVDPGGGSGALVEVPYGGTAWVARRVVARLGDVEVLTPDEVRSAVAALAREEHDALPV
jgi:proteasome accessory factor C